MHRQILSAAAKFFRRCQLAITLYIALQHKRSDALRIVIVDDNPARAAIIKEGLAEAGEDEATTIVERDNLAGRLEACEPDVILIDLKNPSRDELEEIFAISRAAARPIAMFVDQSDEEMTEAAIEAGVSAYIVDGLSKNRIKPILDLAVRRFNAFARLQRELDQARSALADRELVDRAKRILMAQRKVTEPEAYGLLRSQAMNSNRRIAEIAETIVTASELMGGVDDA